jgi:hypothetical protein
MTQPFTQTADVEAPPMHSSSRGSSHARSSGGDPLRRAQNCLETASKRFKRGGSGDAEEIIALLQQATSFIEQAVSGHAGAEKTLHGAE